MADAHVPNSEATPGWKNHKFARTNFPDAIKITPLEGFDGSRYAGNAPVDWCSGAGSKGELPVLGGYLGAVLITAACQFSRVQFQTRAEHDPLSLYVEFLQPIRQGPYHVVLRTLQASASQASIEAEIVPADPATNIVYCHATIRVGSLRRGQTPLAQSIDQRKVVVPDRIKDCSRWVDAFFYYINPPSATVRCYTPTGGPTPLWSPAFGGQNVRYMWNKLDNGQTYELEYLPLLVDLIPPLTLNYEENALEGIVKYQIPTISLKLDFCADVRGKEWLLSKTHLRWLSGSRFDENIKIIDDDGKIVATCHQTLGIYPSRLLQEKEKPESHL